MRFIDSRGAVSGSATSSVSLRARRANRTAPGTRFRTAFTILAGLCAMRDHRVRRASRGRPGRESGCHSGRGLCGRERRALLQVEQRGDHLDTGRAVDQRVVHLGDERLIAVLQPLDDVRLPQRMATIERPAGDVGDEGGELPGAARRAGSAARRRW